MKCELTTNENVEKYILEDFEEIVELSEEIYNSVQQIFKGRLGDEKGFSSTPEQKQGHVKSTMCFERWILKWFKLTYQKSAWIASDK